MKEMLHLAISHRQFKEETLLYLYNDTEHARPETPTPRIVRHTKASKREALCATLFYEVKWGV
jgi:hypothetical protein